MKAVVCTKYGSPEVLQIQDIPKPVPNENEVLVKVHATTVTSSDVRIRSFTYPSWFKLVGRMMFGIRKPRKTTPGDEFAGVVEAAGRDVTQFKEGDQVYGMSTSFGLGGGNAEFVCVLENSGLALKPKNASYEEAAAIPFGGMTALGFLKRANIRNGQKVLVYGASGSVGTYAVQIAKYYGAEVTGVCSTGNLEMVKSIGADEVIDYTQEDFTNNGQQYDVIYDTVMKTSFSRCKYSLNEKGCYITVDWPLLHALWTSVRGQKRVIFGLGSTKTEDMVFLKELVEAGKIKPVIDKTYALDQIVDAHTYVETGHKRGNVVITVV
ncbi:MAG: NAD(P)-dependent alcohol dehydrogenase [Dehalococcoidales bacterium]|nr:MAG: NAD(P)-dependent alcohol dehydrogenase [Dehalococcoidales bacterium]